MKLQLQWLAALAAGTLFGLGLSVAQMIDPAKVINFLDVFGTWDPSLAFVMAGALAVNVVATPLILKRRQPILAELFRVPAKTELDKPLILGSLIFGAGWGLAGYCPGPMITSVSFIDGAIFTVLLSYVLSTLFTRLAMRRYDAYKAIKHQKDEACVG